MTENTTEIDRIEASDVFARASQLPEDNHRARTIAQLAIVDEADRDE